MGERKPPSVTAQRFASYLQHAAKQRLVPKEHEQLVYSSVADLAAIGDQTSNPQHSLSVKQV
jgi:hypothetical protein